MTKQQFWGILGNARTDDLDTFYFKLENIIQSLPKEDKKAFSAYLSAYMDAVNECIWVDMACKVINGYISDDTVIFFALWLISQGEDSVLRALKEPDSLSEISNIPFGNANFEMLMAVAFDEENSCEDVELRTQCIEEITSSVCYKNNDKYGGYDNFEDAIEDIPNILPNLIIRAKEKGFNWQHMYDI